MKVTAQQSANGGSFMSMLFLIFLTLKLTNYIDWSWWAVTAPLWAPAALVLVIGVIAGFIYTVIAVFCD